jgi:UDP-glucose 4-epimerase
MAKILVTGGLGLIGHNVVQQLEKQGHSIAIVDTKTTYGIIPKSELDYLMEERKRKIRTNSIYNYDIADPRITEIFERFKPEIVIHLASFPRQKVVNANPQAGSRAMSEGLLNLLEASVKHNIRKFVYISSSMVYGNFKDPYNNGIDENHPTNPIGQYGIMKLAGEWLVRDYQRRTNMAYTIIRPSAVYGPLDVEDRVISKFILTAMRGGVLNVNGANETLDFTYVDDAANGIVAAALSSDSDNSTYNITKSHSKTLLEAAELAIRIVGKGTLNVQGKDADFPSRGALNIGAARRDFGFAPQVDVEEGFEQYYDWLKNSVYWSQKTV